MTIGCSGRWLDRAGPHGPARHPAAPRARRSGARASSGGQATVEVALLLPVVLVLVLAVLQVALVGRDAVRCTTAARAAARSAAVDPSPATARAAAADSSGLAPARLSVGLGPRGQPGDRVRAEVTCRSVTDLPLVGPLVGDVVLHARATMRVED